MNIAYVTTYDSADINSWSGLGSFIFEALRSAGPRVEPIGNLRDNHRFITKFKKTLYSKILSKKYLSSREPLRLRSYATQVEKALATISHDVIFSPGTIPVAYLRSEKPLVFWTDATFAGMINFYPGYSNLCTETINNGNKMEQLALSKCNIAIYSSAWAANSAIQNYDVDPAKVKVVPFGANINCNRKYQDIFSIIQNKPLDIVKLLFVGVDWYRKGGDIALAVADRLNQRGIRTELHIVGCKPPVSLPRFVKCHGFISKKTEEGRRFFESLMNESHFLILPSRAECFGVVFAEASSFGLPSLATDVGGIPTAIQSGKNGQIFSLDEGPDGYCDYIEKVMSSKQKYQELAQSSFREYSARLNWLTSGRKVHDLIKEFCH